MKLTWTFYPKPGQLVTLTVIYKPALDAAQLAAGGVLHVDSNTAFVDWSTYQRLADGDNKTRKEAFARLSRINDLRCKLPDGSTMSLQS